MKKTRTRNLDFIRWSTLALVVFVASVGIGSASAGPTSSTEKSSGAAMITTAASPNDPAPEVKIDNFAFTPAVITIKVGTEVTWINKDDIPHTVDSTEGTFKSAALDTDDKFHFRFTAAGEYPFFCRMHPKMTGKIVVQP